MKKRKSPKITITIPADLMESVREFAEQEDRTISNAIAHLTRIGQNIATTRASYYVSDAPEKSYRTTAEKKGEIK